MTSEQFINWLSGFISAIEGTPTQDQWIKLQKAIEEISKKQQESSCNSKLNEIFTRNNQLIPSPPINWPNNGRPPIFTAQQQNENKTLYENIREVKI